MWKWIVGILGAIVLVVCLFLYAGYQQMAAGGDSVIVTIAGPPGRVFASLATPDSMAAWVITGQVAAPLGRGMLSAGDTLRLEDPRGPAAGRPAGPRWLVREVSAPSRLELELIPDSGMSRRSRSGAPRIPFLLRRDSLFAKGDSTVVVSTFSAPSMSAMRQTAADTSSRIGGALMSGAGKMLIGSQRMVREMDLKGLKAHVEGKVPR